METPGNSSAATLLNLESSGSRVVGEGTRPVLFATRLIVGGMAGYYMGCEDLGRLDCTVAAVSSVSGAFLRGMKENRAPQVAWPLVFQGKSGVTGPLMELVCDKLC